MNYRMCAHLLGVILLIEAGLLAVPAVVAILFGESVMPFALTVGVLLVVALPWAIYRPKDQKIYTKDGFMCVAAAWMLMSLFGALPFVFSGAIPNYVDAVFETVSGFTTTGATILTAVEHLPKGILFWRSFSHWIGGMGVLVFMLAILPSDDGRAIHLLRAEVPGPTKGKLVPKLRKTARILYGIYIGLTALEFIALLLAGLPAYDAAVNSFATTGTGGFSVKNASIAGYGSPAVEWIVAVFMFLSGINFNLYFFLLIGRWREVIHSEELKVYGILCGTSVALICWNTVRACSGLGECVRNAFFQVSSIISTTGFSTLDYEAWPAFAKSIILLLTLTGACAGSTAGGLKLSRVMILVKNVRREIKHMLHPHSVNVIRMDGEVLDEGTVKGAANYFALYAVVLVALTVVVSLDGFDQTTNLTAALTCLNNVGPGFSVVGPAGNFAGFSVLSKIALTFGMLVGRLEIMPIFIFFSPASWKRGR